MRRLRNLGSERGMALVLALGVLVAVSATSVVVIEYTNSNSHSADKSKGDQKAFAVAEAGINNAMAVLSDPDNNALNECLLRPQPPPSGCASLAPFEHVYEGGTVRWWGLLDKFQAVWTVTSTGTARNAFGGAELTRTLTAKVPVVPTNTQPLNNQAWNYIMSVQDTGAACDMTIGNDVEVRTNLYVFGNLCLQNQAKILNSAKYKIRVVVKKALSLATSNNTVGTSGDPLGEAHIGVGCKYRLQHWHPDAGDGHPFCSSVDMVFASTLDQQPGTIVPPAPDWQAWWQNGSPGPFFACTTQSGVPPVFDNDASSTSAPNASVTATFNLTPSASYSCWTAGGEISWDAAAKKLTVSGTVFFDGYIRIDPATANQVIEYDGHASIYAYGTVAIKNVSLCAVIASGACDFENWDPNTELLAFVANGSGGQNDVNAGESIAMKSSKLQGALFGTNKVVLSTDSDADGPMVGSEVVLGQATDTDAFPNIVTVPAGMPGNPTVYAQPNSPEMFSG